MILVFGPQSADYEIQLLRRDRRCRCRWSSLRVIGLTYWGKDFRKRVGDPSIYAGETPQEVYRLLCASMHDDW